MEKYDSEHNLALEKSKFVMTYYSESENLPSSSKVAEF